jgi:hypothetical protein
MIEREEYLIQSGDGSWLADRTSAVFDGIPYRWTTHEQRAKRMGFEEARKVLAEVAGDVPEARVVEPSDD